METFLLSLYDSPRFTERHALNQKGSEAFITFLYQRLLDQEPDPASLSNLKMGIENGSLLRRDIYRNIISSPEFRSKYP